MNSPPNIDFRDRNAVERFLETKRFRRCTNLECKSVNHPKMHVLYMPVCLEGRFAKEGVAREIEIPLPNRPLSPITYTTVPIWAPLVSCPSACKGYRNRTVAKVLALFKRQPHSEDSPKPKSKWEWWVAGILVPVAIAIFALFQPEVRVWLRLEKPKPAIQRSNQSLPPPTVPTSSPSTPPEATPSAERQTGTKTRTNQHAKSKVTGNSNVAGNNVAGNGNAVGNNNQVAPTAIAPNGIAIAGGTVTNPTVNNYSPSSPHMKLDDIGISLIASSMQDFKNTTVRIVRIGATEESTSFANGLVSALQKAGWSVEDTHTELLFLPQVGQPPKGMSVSVAVKKIPIFKKLCDILIDKYYVTGEIRVYPVTDVPDRFTIYITPY